ncbi:MAG: sigma-70 family RNA polymerase sigma factor [Lachnospiraceae bacterium]|nr:sigma-70 family RNA polymerase sigma factor [Lachnospiraceae bacterium]
MIPIDEFHQIYITYADTVKKFLVCLTHNYDLAEELMQETFYQVYKSIDRYNGKCKMSVWLCQIAKHVFYDYLKKQTKHFTVSVEAQAELSLEPISEDMDVEEQVLNKIRAEGIRREIGNLNQPYQKVFLLRLFGEMSFREIGDTLGKSENWARVTFYRAKVMLIERVGEKWD